MNKIFTNTIFVGKKHINLPSCHSTNDLAASMAANNDFREGTLISTDDQTKGRGQIGNTWDSEPAQNITCSLMLRPQFLGPNHTFYLNIITSLAICKTLEQYLPGNKIKIKWPNDVYVNEKKISGILIENSLQTNKIGLSIIGIGLNVNQKHFKVSNAISMYQLSGDLFDRFVIMQKLMVNFEQYYFMLKNQQFALLREAYLDQLYWKNEIHVFKVHNELINGIIKTIDDHGRLVVEHESKTVCYNFKEIQYHK